jgi:hypothetical protein
MTSISKNHTSYTVLVAIGTLAVILVAGSVGSHQMVYAKGAVGSHQMLFGNKHFFMAFPSKRVDNGKQPTRQAIGQPTNNDQKGICLTAGGGSGITGSCTNAATTTTTNTGGIGSIGGSSGGNGKQPSGQAIEQPTDNNQGALCITTGGNSPITGSCTNAATTTTTNTGGIGSIGGSSGGNGKQAIEQPTNNNQKALCITLGGNSPISASCTQISASTTTNTGGILGFIP